MTRTAARQLSNRKSAADLESWLLGEPDLDADARALLAAYRDAVETARTDAAAKPAAPAADASGDADRDAATEPTSHRAVPPVPRLRAVDGIDPARLASSHGRLLAVGYLTTELLGRSDGLAYRVTRDGLRRLSGEPADAESAGDAEAA